MLAWLHMLRYIETNRSEELALQSVSLKEWTPGWQRDFVSKLKREEERNPRIQHLNIWLLIHVYLSNSSYAYMERKREDRQFLLLRIVGCYHQHFTLDLHEFCGCFHFCFSFSSTDQTFACSKLSDHFTNGYWKNYWHWEL